MNKYKVTYYTGTGFTETEVEAHKFDTKENTGGMSVTFYGTETGNFRIFAFSNFISVEKID